MGVKEKKKFPKWTREWECVAIIYFYSFVSLSCCVESISWKFVEHLLENTIQTLKDEHYAQKAFSQNNLEKDTIEETKQIEQKDETLLLMEEKGREDIFNGFIKV